MTTTSSRRTILAGAATMPALAIPAGTLATRFSFGPVFAAIENHRVKEARISTLAAGADNDLPDEIADVLYHEEWTALNELATTPTTLQGCAAASRYIEVYTKAASKAACSLTLARRAT